MEGRVVIALERGGQVVWRKVSGLARRGIQHLIILRGRVSTKNCSSLYFMVVEVDKDKLRSGCMRIHLLPEFNQK